MAKDPAFLFYSSDFLTGTMTMTNEQVGKYIRLMCLQHQKGKLTEKDMMHICQTYDDDVFQKFIKDEAGFYKNERLGAEIQRRMDYSQSRRNNRLHKNISKSYDEHMETENETENINVTVVNKGGVGEKEKRPDEATVINYFCEIGLDDFTAQAQAKLYINHYTSNGWKVGKNTMKDWKAAARGWKERMKEYKNSINGTHQQASAGNKAGTSEARIEALKKW